jgi:hypothetical protein
MAEPARGDRLVVWSLATFHTAFFVAVVVALLHVSGTLAGLLRSLNTAIGLAIFGTLWTTTFWSTRHLLEDLQSGPRHPSGTAGAFIGWAAFWGGVNGVAFLLLVVIGAVLAALPTTLVAPDRSLGLAVGLIYFVVPLGSAVAFMVGFVVGLVLGAVDSLALALSLCAVSPHGRISA